MEDIQKRSVYRKKHGLEHEGFGGWTAKEDAEDLGPALSTGVANRNVVVAGVEGEEIGEPVQMPKRKVKKWLGIW